MMWEEEELSSEEIREEKENGSSQAFGAENENTRKNCETEEVKVNNTKLTDTKKLKILK
jgi:hypothetical protein